MRVKVNGKVIPASFLKIEGRRIEAKDRREREGQLEELENDDSSSSAAPPRSKIDRERWEQRRCQERSNCQKSDGEK